MRSDMATGSFTCKVIPAFTAQPQRITALWLVGPTHVTVLHRVEGLGAGYIVTVTHPSTNRAQCRLTSLIETNALPVRQTANKTSKLNTLHSLLDHSRCLQTIKPSVCWVLFTHSQPLSGMSFSNDKFHISNHKRMQQAKNSYILDKFT